MSKISEKRLKRLKLQIEMVKHLLKYRFTWDEISEAIGFSKEWLIFSEKIVKENQEDIRCIKFLATNGKLELEEDAKRFLNENT